MSNPEGASGGLTDVSWSAQWLTDLLLPVMRYRIAIMGDRRSGAFQYYRTRLDVGCVFDHYEIALANALAASGLPVRHIHEIGCGWGQFVFLLAWSGYRAVGYEFDEARFLGADSFRRVLRHVDPERASLIKIARGAFPPETWAEEGRDLVIATNLVHRDAVTAENAIIRGLHRYRYAIIDIDRFGMKRAGEDSAAVVARLEQSGLRNHGMFCDVQDGARFYLFESR